MKRRGCAAGCAFKRRGGIPAPPRLGNSLCWESCLQPALEHPRWVAGGPVPGPQLQGGPGDPFATRGKMPLELPPAPLQSEGSPWAASPKWGSEGAGMWGTGDVGRWHGARWCPSVWVSTGRDRHPQEDGVL